MRLLIAALSLLVLTAADVAVQTPSRDRGATPPARDPADQALESATAVISGVVRAMDTGRPLGRARVLATLSGSREARAAQTDDNGRYELAALAAGRYTITVSKPGYVTLSLGQKRPRQPPVPLQLRAGEQLRQVDLLLPRGGVISGRVLDEHGSPFVRAMVQVLRYEYRQGVRRLVPEGMDQTDDRGLYRVFDLTPGEYYVTAQPPRGRGGRFFGGGSPRTGPLNVEEEEVDVNYAPTYYPGTTSRAGSSRVSVGLSQELADVDFPLQLVPTATIEGHVFAAAGHTLFGGVVMLSEGDEGFQPRHRARFGDDGAFKLQSVPPGDYRLVAQGDVEGIEGRVTSSMPLAVNGVDMRTVSVALSPGVSVSGRVVVEGVTGATALNPGAVEVIAESADPALPRLRASGWPGPDLGFTIANVGQGTQRIRVAYLPSGWRLKSALLGGEDVADVAFDIRRPEPLQGLTVVLTDQPTSITGAVVNDRGEPLSDYTVVVFPSDERLWLSGSRRIVGRRPDQLGHFEIRDLPAGDYRMAAVEFVEEGEWNDPVFLERLRARALSFTLADGDSVVRDLKVVTLTQP